ncbi:hypothetical protein LCGC14_2985860, partial [marine sediment metagenome]
WIEVDSITFKKSGNEDLVVDTFTIPALDLIDAETFQINLLDYQGRTQILVVNDLELASGNYTDMVLSVIRDVNKSYVVEVGEAGDTHTELRVNSAGLKLGAFTVDAEGTQTITAEFDLRKGLTHSSAGNGHYTLKERGVRLQDNSGDRVIEGRVAASLFNTESPCSEKEDPTLGNVVYLYEGFGLAVENLADMIDPDITDEDRPDGAIAPFAATTVTENGDGSWAYTFAYLPAGDYTLVFSCDVGSDDPEYYDGLTLPFPAGQIIERSAQSSGINCDFPIDDNGKECD